MYKDRKILALVPARGGSKGLPRKNLLPLLGEPLVGWSIKQGLACPIIDRVIVSTDDNEIAMASKKAGADVPFMRPAELAMDYSTSINVVFHALDWLTKNGEVFDYLVLLEPTSPLRAAHDLERALMMLIDQENDSDAIVSLGEVHLENPYVMKTIRDSRIVPLLPEIQKITQRQQCPKVYFPYGVIYASKVSSLRSSKTFYPEKTIPYFIARWQNYEVDDVFDFACIEAILKKQLQDVAR